MITTIKKLLLTPVVLALLLVGSATVVATQPAYANDAAKKSACEATGGSWSGGGCNKAQAEASINNTLDNVINIFSVIVGIVAVVMIIVGGFKYITSSGDSSKVSSAKNTILYAIIGLVVVALAQIIVRFVLSNAT